jgi:hypothetical protein
MRNAENPFQGLFEAGIRGIAGKNTKSSNLESLLLIIRDLLADYMGFELPAAVYSPVSFRIEKTLLSLQAENRGRIWEI